MQHPQFTLPQCGVVGGAVFDGWVVVAGFAAGVAGGVAGLAGEPAAISFCKRVCCCLARLCTTLPGWANCAALFAESSACRYFPKLSCATDRRKYTLASGDALRESTAFCSSCSAAAKSFSIM